MSTIIDRRLDPRGKNAVNRGRFLRRYKEQIKRAVGDLISKRGVTDMDQGGTIGIPKKDIREPVFRHGAGGDHEYVLPGNRKFKPGDKLPRPSSGDGDGDGGEGDGTETKDDYTFSLSREEFMNLFFGDMELPNLVRNFLGEVKEYRMQRAGYTHTGAPPRLAITRSLREALGRRVASRGALRMKVAELEALKEKENDPEARAKIEQEIARLRVRLAHVRFIDEIDLRFRHHVMVPLPTSRAVMFCLMDASASMTQEKKDLAKRFFTLLYLFLLRKYEKVEIVFIRHTDKAAEVDEERFFKETASGGTVVESALQLMAGIIEERYSPELYNIYGAQVSDGDAFGADPGKSREVLEKKILPAARYYVYAEVPDDPAKTSALSHAYARVKSDRFRTASMTSPAEVYHALRGLFRREGLVEEERTAVAS